MKCLSCGASLVDDALACAYCSAPTALSEKRREAEISADIERADAAADAEAERASERVDRARASLGRTSTHSVVWSSVGLVTCCFPAGSIVGLVMAIRARKMANKYKLVLPASATAGLVLSIVGLLMAGTLWTWYGFDQQRLSARRAELSTIIEQGVEAERLSETTACALAELRLLQDGYGDKSETAVKDFECAGRVDQKGDRAELPLIRFRTGNHLKWDVRGCYERGARWTLDSFRRRKPCSVPEEEPVTKKKKAGSVPETDSNQIDPPPVDTPSEPKTP